MQLRGKGLFVFSDPGGAKALLSLAYLEQKNLQQVLVFSDRIYDFYSDFGFTVESLQTGSVDSILEKARPDFIVTGTSYTSNIELEFIKKSKEKQIRSYSFIDHWTSILDRFKREGSLTLPDSILVIDSRASGIAEKEGIKKEIINIIGNPYYTFLKSWKPAVSKLELFAQLGISGTDTKLVVYAPEPLSNINGREKFGFDELTATSQIAEILESNTFNFYFVLKAHPNQDISLLYKIKGQKIFLTNSVDSTTLMYYSDLIIGFFSNFLIEASIFKKNIVRFLPVNNGSDSIAELNIGNIVDKKGLIRELNIMNDAG